jgi:hypothetical protein
VVSPSSHPLATSPCCPPADDTIRIAIGRKYVQIQNGLDAMYVDKLDGRITSACYDRRAAEFRADQDRIQTALADHQQANQSYLDSGIRLLELASQAADLSYGRRRRRVGTC